MVAFSSSAALVSIFQLLFLPTCSPTTLPGVLRRRLFDIFVMFSSEPDHLTKQEVERSNFWIEIPRIWKRFWFAFVLCFIAIAAIVILSTGLIPPEWRIPGSSWAVILPLAIVAAGHILFPVSSSMTSQSDRI